MEPFSLTGSLALPMHDPRGCVCLKCACVFCHVRACVNTLLLALCSNTGVPPTPGSREQASSTVPPNGPPSLTFFASLQFPVQRTGLPGVLMTRSFKLHLVHCIVAPLTPSLILWRCPTPPEPPGRTLQRIRPNIEEGGTGEMTQPVIRIRLTKCSLNYRVIRTKKLLMQRFLRHSIAQPACASHCDALPSVNACTVRCGFCVHFVLRVARKIDMHITVRLQRNT